MRPGEKLFEELLIGDNVSPTDHSRILKAQEDFLPIEIINKNLQEITSAEERSDVTQLKELLKSVVTGFTPEEQVSDVLTIQKEN